MFFLPEPPSARLIACWYVFSLLAVTMPALLGWIPDSMRERIVGDVRLTLSAEAYERLRRESDEHAVPGPDFSRVRSNARRGEKVPAWLAVPLALALPLVFLLPGVALVIGVLAGTGALTVFSRASKAWSRLSSCRLELDGSDLHQLDRSGAVVASIDLARPFTFEYVDKAMGSAIYQLRQGDRRLEFTSDDPLARHVVPGLLGLEWPPMDRLSSWLELGAGPPSLELRRRLRPRAPLAQRHRLRRVVGHREKAPVLRAHEAVGDRALDPGEQGIEEARRVEQDDRAVVEAELAEGEDLAELLEGAEAAGEGDEGVAVAVEAGLARAHVVDALHLDVRMMDVAAIDEVAQDHPAHAAARGERRVGDGAHEADLRAAVHEEVAAPGDLRAERARRADVRLADPPARAAEDRDAHAG
jgi:hypothetical protein